MSSVSDEWSDVTLGQIANYVNGRGFAKSEWETKGLPIVRIQNLNDHDAAFNYSSAQHEAKYRIESGDILISWAASLGVYEWKRGPGWLNQHIFRVELDEDQCDRRLYLHALEHAMAALRAKAHGSGMVHITKGKFESHTLSLPPRAAQPALADKIDELFSRIDEGERALRRVETLVERYRQSVLKAAVTGELTRDWRAANRERLAAEGDTGQALLDRILTARREAWETAELEKLIAKGQPPKTDAWKAKYKEPVAPDTDGLPELPEGWVWANVGQLGLVTGGLTKNSKRALLPDKRPYLRVANVYASELRLDEVHEIGVKPSELARVTLKRGDLLVVEGNGSPDQIGRVAIWDGAIDGCVHQNHLIKVRFADDWISQWAATWLASPHGKASVRSVASSTSGLYTLSLRKVESLAVPLPPEIEAAAVIAESERRITSIAAAEHELGPVTNRSSALRQAVLSAAFSGQLITENK